MEDAAYIKSSCCESATYCCGLDAFYHIESVRILSKEISVSEKSAAHLRGMVKCPTCSTLDIEVPPIV